MAKIPGLTFSDPTVTKFHLSHNFDIINGQRSHRDNYVGIGEQEVDSVSCLYINNTSEVSYDPSLTYGRTKVQPISQFVPDFVLFDKKCLTFNAFFKQSVSSFSDEPYRVRIVKIIYFLEDDTILVTEPTVQNCGYQQGRLIRRSKLPKSNTEYWHWKDFNIGIDVVFNGIFFHIVDCDKFTKEYLSAQGIVLRTPEEMPSDPYVQEMQLKKGIKSHGLPIVDKFAKFLEYSGKVLKFNALWDDTCSEYGERTECIIYYYLLDDTISVRLQTPNMTSDMCPVLIKNIKVPKVWFANLSSFPAYLERHDDDIAEFYSPKDFLVGETIYLLGRKFLLLDCDQFTRDYYKHMLGINQREVLKQNVKEEKPVKKPIVLGSKSLEMNKIINANKYLRYELKMVPIHPEDEIREFVMRYSLANGTIEIFEKNIPNSGIIGGKYLRSTYLRKPDWTVENSKYYSLADFYVGAIINVNSVRFTITNLDLSVYHYMEANPEKFPETVIQNVKNHMVSEGFISAVLTDKEEKYYNIPTMEDIVVSKTERDICLDQINEKLKSTEEYHQKNEKFAKENVNFEDNIYKVKSSECNVQLIKDDCKMTDLFEKHYPPPEKEIVRKYYNNVFNQYKELQHKKCT